MRQVSRKFEELEEGKPFAIFKVKIDISEQSFNNVNVNLIENERKRLTLSYGRY